MAASTAFPLVFLAIDAKNPLPLEISFYPSSSAIHIIGPKIACGLSNLTHYETLMANLCRIKANARRLCVRAPEVSLSFSRVPRIIPVANPEFESSWIFRFMPSDRTG